MCLPELLPPRISEGQGLGAGASAIHRPVPSPGSAPGDVAGLLLLGPTPDDLFAELKGLPAAAQAALRPATTESARKAGHSEAIVWDVHRIDESCQQVHRAVVLEKPEKRLPHIPVLVVVVVTAAILERPNGKPVACGS
jgi:hypothetical protein